MNMYNGEDTDPIPIRRYKEYNGEDTELIPKKIQGI